jgi:hypothetical protein
MEIREHEAPAELDRARRPALAVGVLGLAGGAALGMLALGVERTLYSYLVGWVFWTGIAVGCLALAMLHQLSGGQWGVVIRRPLEAAVRTLPLLLVLFVPLALGVADIYEWARPELVEHDHVLQHKQAYLNVPFFLGRVAVYFAIWIGLGTLLVRWSDAQDRSGDPEIQHKLRTLCGPGLALYALTVSFAAVDWVMSLDPHWFSMIFGILTIGGQGLGALAFIVATLVLLARYAPLRDVVEPGHLHDLGKLMLAFVMLWAYFAFSQFLIIWSGNLAEEIPWYLRRLEGGWKWMGLAIALLHFALPFALLLSRDLKRRSNRLVGVALLVVLMRMVDTIWMIAPEFHGEMHVSAALGVLTDLLALAGLGGLWVWWYLGRLRQRPLLPLHDPNVDAAAAEVVAET